MTLSRCVLGDERAEVGFAVGEFGAPSPTRRLAMRSSSLAMRSSAVCLPTATATEMAMQRSPAEP